LIIETAKKKQCNAFIEELCSSFDKEELNGACQICGIKIAFHKRKKIKNVKHIKHITQITNHYANDVLFNKHNEKSGESTERKDMVNLPMNLLKILCIEWLDIWDISQLDHALCESTKRKTFHEALNGIKLPGLRIIFQESPYYADWYNYDFYE
jgi:hypothetical protein